MAEQANKSGGSSRLGYGIVVVAVALSIALSFESLRSLIWPCNCAALTCGQQSSRALLTDLGLFVEDCGICEAGSGCCEPQCGGKCAGADNACGGTCNTICASTERCDNGECICSPQCLAKCGGDDGCGGKCEDTCPVPASCGDDNTSCVTPPSYALCGPGAGCGSAEPLHVIKGPICSIASSAGGCNTASGDCYVCPATDGASVAVCGPMPRCSGGEVLAVTSTSGSCAAASSTGKCSSPDGLCAICVAQAEPSFAICGPEARCSRARPLASTSAPGPCEVSSTAGTCASASADGRCAVCVAPAGTSSEALCDEDVECSGKPLAGTSGTGSCGATSAANKCSLLNGQCAVCASQ